MSMTREVGLEAGLAPTLWWLSTLPSHWRTTRLKFHLTRNDSGIWGSDPEDDAIPVLRSTEQTIDGSWRIKSPAYRTLSASECRETRLRQGDLVVTKSSGSPAHIGKTSLVDA